ncbi:NlpC/P60 family protein [Streptomyces sp. GC420]|uniref:C40 family peptidase n=1 Tax=Streptomyces sp. GC420 TaxID=2697568 RepID=UPI0014152F3B|nr:C40 family peptidase [Streptomyces sp. GC420]NBM16362.1 hypothetical protein [Streptomyces sp. GC420]
MASHRRPARFGLTQSARVTVLSAAAVTAAAVVAAVPATAEPGSPPGPRESVRAQVGRLYEEAERATERFNAADERTDRLRRQVELAKDRAARDQDRVNRMRDGLGSLAGAQYRSGGLDPSLRLLLAADPDEFLERAMVVDRVTDRQAGQLRALRQAQRVLEQDRARALRKLAELERGRAVVARHKRSVERRLAEARRLLNSLRPDEREAYARAGRYGRDGSVLPGGVMAGGPGAASPRAAAALAAARGAVGRPYVWGASGPGAFDCSGLMQWAYGQAGVALPRTSQAQRYAGRQVPLSEARPGDLVTYRSDASHVAMYAGNGQVVHAPHPGARVRYDPVNMMPGLTVTRI